MRIKNMQDRMEYLIDETLAILMAKVSSGMVKINKEASFQLHFSNILLKLSEIYTLNNDEKLEIILESSINFPKEIQAVLKKGKVPEVDILFIAKDKGKTIFSIAIELKFYKEYSSTGKSRGATNLFMRDVYVDIEMLEHYQTCGQVDQLEVDKINQGVLIIGTDFEYFTKRPEKSDANCWVCDTSSGAKVTKGKNIMSNHTVNGEKKEYPFCFKSDYEFNWKSAFNNKIVAKENDYF